jgi:hypothetical protein
MKTFDCVLFDCSGSMSMSAVAHPLAQGADSRTLMHYALDMLFDMYGEGNLDGRTLIVPFDSVVRGGITMDLLVKMSRDEVMKLFEPAGGTNIKEAFDYCGSSNTLLITDDPSAGRVMGSCCPIIYVDQEVARSLTPSRTAYGNALLDMQWTMGNNGYRPE